MKKFVKVLLVAVLALAMLFAVAGCAKDAGTPSNENENGASVSDNDKGAAAKEIEIAVDVIGKDGNTKKFEIKTTAKNLEDALLEGEPLIAGDESEYGLYITTVDGEVADYDKDKAYWCIMKDDEPLTTGAKDTKIADGEHYKLVYTVVE